MPAKGSSVRAGPCAVIGCGIPIYSRGMCKTHYNRQWRGDDLSVTDPAYEFNRRVDKSGECWVWIGALSLSGYGRISRGRKKLRAHRVSYEMHVGPIPDGMHVLHRCDNPPCVNPAHLWLGTHIDNMRDMEAKGRAKWIQENIANRSAQ